LHRTTEVARWSPACRALYGCWQTLHRPLHFDWSHSPLLQLPALEGWHLYEIWCFLTVADRLLRLGWQPVASAPEAALLHCAPDGLRLRLATGRASELRLRPPDRDRVAPLILTYQPLFSSANRHQPSHLPPLLYSSLTHDMRPDIALQWRGRLYLLDAKYRRYAPREAADNRYEDTAGNRDYNALLEDLDKMHTYRDSIVRDGRRTVHHAWCLFPGEPAPDPQIMAYPTGTPERPYGTAGIGAIALRPGAPSEALTGLLAHWFSNSLP
jgi:hypothetical protein